MASQRYRFILKQYPEYISYCDICSLLHFSRRKVKWMLEKGWIPATIKKGQVNRYTIKTKDFIDFLISYDEYPENYNFPPSAFSNNLNRRAMYKDRYTVKPPTEIIAYLTKRWKDQPEMLTLETLASLTHYSKYTCADHLCAAGIKPVFVCGKNYYQKEAAIRGIAAHHSMRPQDFDEFQRRIFLTPTKAPKRGGSE